MFGLWSPPGYLPCPSRHTRSPAQEEHPEFLPSWSSSPFPERHELTTLYTSLLLPSIQHTTPSLVLTRHYAGMKETILPLRSSGTSWHGPHVTPSTLPMGLLLDTHKFTDLKSLMQCFPCIFGYFMIGHLWLFGYLWLNWSNCKIKCKVQWIIKYNKSLSFGYPEATFTESEFRCQRESKDHTDEETEAWGEDWLAQRHTIRNKSWRSRTSSPGLNSDDHITQ